MLCWLSSPRLGGRPARLILNLGLLTTILLATLPAHVAHAAGEMPPLQAQPQQPAPPEQIFFDNNGVAQAQDFVDFNVPLVYTFNASLGDRVAIQLSSPNPPAPLPTYITFEFAGPTNTVIKARENPTNPFSFTLTSSGTYKITVINTNPTSNDVPFRLTVTLGSGSGTAERIEFIPGQTVAWKSGQVSAGQDRQFVFYAEVGQRVNIIINSTGGLANFTVRGVTDNVFYKPASDSRTNWTFDVTRSQDYLVTVSTSSVAPVAFSLQVTRSLPGIPIPIRLVFDANGTAVVSGTLQAGVPVLYSFYAVAGQQVRILLTTQPAGNADFAVSGAFNGVTYKQMDGQREWSFSAPATQDYWITLLSNANVAVISTYQLEVFVSPTPTPTPVVPPPPPGCTTNLIQNGNFETDGFWVFGDTPVPPAYTSLTVHSPYRAVRLGIDPALGAGVQNRKSFSSVRQPFQIPIEASIAQLRWWNFYRTEEAQTDSPGLGQDKQEVVLLKPDLSTVAVLRSVRRNNNNWIEELVDLTPYRGQSLVIYFNVYNDGNGQRTWQFLDDVAINICYPEVTPTPVVPTSTPLPTLVPTLIMPTLIMPTLAIPTLLPSTVAPALLPATLPATEIASPLSATPVANAMPGAFPGVQPIPGEPEIVMLPTGQPGVAAAAVQGPQGQAAAVQVRGTQVQAAAVQVQIQRTATPAPPASTQGGPRIFNRPLTEVLTWIGIMLGALAVIGILVALIWLAPRRDETAP